MGPGFLLLSPPADPVGEGIGHFLGAMRVDAFRPADTFKRHMDNWIRRFRSSTPAEGHDRVMIPGDPERESEVYRKQNGIPVNPKVFEDLKELAKRFDISGLV